MSRTEQLMPVILALIQPTHALILITAKVPGRYSPNVIFPQQIPSAPPGRHRVTPGRLQKYLQHLGVPLNLLGGAQNISRGWIVGSIAMSVQTTWLSSQRNSDESLSPKQRELLQFYSDDYWRLEGQLICSISQVSDPRSSEASRQAWSANNFWKPLSDPGDKVTLVSYLFNMSTAYICILIDTETVWLVYLQEGSNMRTLTLHRFYLPRKCIVLLSIGWVHTCMCTHSNTMLCVLITIR